MSDNIKVAIKVRPLVEREKDESLQWNVSGNTITPMDSKRRNEAGFQFDHIFGMQKKNEDIFNIVVKPIINSAVNGFNGTVFAYGQTGSGKTYTMMGTDLEPGIIPQAINHMFDLIGKTLGREFLIRFSYFEIYNEKINDLLEVQNTDLKIKEENGRIFVNKCSEKVTNGAKHMLTSMKMGEKNRSFGETNMNERSSRSHTIFRITIESREINSDSDGVIQIAQLNLVDLAGSERASQTGATGDRFKEGKHINLSLSTLGLVIKQLSETQDKPNFVNFRDSKLTRILQASLGGNSLTAILCTVTPASFEETHCSLSFASRAKSIKNKPELNEDLSDEALLKRYKKQISELSKELEKANQTIKDNQNNVLAQRVELLKEYIVSANQKKNVRRRSCPVKFGYKTFDLHPIIEDPGPETPKHAKIEKIKRRQSIIQSAKTANETTTALADFEIDLLQSDLEPDEEFFISSRKAYRPRVKFLDVDDIREFDTQSSYSDISPDKTPSRRCNSTINSSPGTPKSVLRERLKTVLEEHAQLAEFTTLEKQLRLEDGQPMNLDENEKTLRGLKKSLEDTSILYFDTNKKYSDLQTEQSILLDECKSLRKQVEFLSPIQERFAKLEVENKELRHNLNIAVKAQKFAEDENVSLSFQMESMQTKFKAREKELETSLQAAWKSDPVQAEQSKSEILQLQNLVKTLNEEVDRLKSEKPLIQDCEPVISEIESLKEKLEETNRLLKESDFEKSSLVERLESLSQRLLMKSKIEEYDNLLRNFEEDKIRSLHRFDELAKELEERESGLEISALQKAVDNLSSHLTELEREDVHVRRKFSVFLACIEFSCQENSEKSQLADDELDLSLNFEHLRKKVTYDEKEKSDIILELQKFRESVIRRSKSLESKPDQGIENEKEAVKTEDKTTLTEETLEEEKIAELEEKLDQANLEKVKLEQELQEAREKLLESGEKWKDYENIKLKLESSESKILELNAKIEELESKNTEMKTKLEETSEGLEIYLNEINKLNSRIIDFDVEKLELNTNLAEMVEKLKIYESRSEKMEELQELSRKIEEVEAENSRLTSQISVTEEKLESAENSVKLCDDLQSELVIKEGTISELTKKLSELEDINKDLRCKTDEAEDKIKILEASIIDNRRVDDFESNLTELETELNELKLKVEELNLENMESKFKLTEAEAKLREYESLLEVSKEDTRIVEDLRARIAEKEAEITDLGKKSKELETLNLELKSQLVKVTESIEIYVERIESLKLESESKVKELEEENAEIKVQLELNKESESSFCAVDSRIEEKEAEIAQLSLRIKELGDENFELKSRVEEAEEKLKNYEETISSLRSDVERLSGKLQEREIDVTHLTARCKELENVNNSFTKSMNNTKEESFADLKSGEDLVKSYLAEKEAIKQRIEDFEKNVSIFREDIDEQRSFAEGLEKDDLVESEKILQNQSSKMSTPTKMDQSVNFVTPKNTSKSIDENDFTSIFANESYFEKMEVDETMIENETQSSEKLIETAHNESDLTAPSMMIDVLKSNDVSILKRRVRDLEAQNVHLDNLHKDLIRQVNENGGEELARSVKEFKNVKILLEMDNSRLREDLQQKISESEEIKNGILGLKMDIEKLQQTIYLLNTENLELTCKLNGEKQKNAEMENSREKQVFRSDLECKIDGLKMENQKLTEELMYKIKELDSIKECKALEFDHECGYKDKNEALLKTIDSLQNEITELSDDLMKHIDDSETNKQELDVALKKLLVYEQAPKVSKSPGNILQEKTHLEAQVIELKSKVTKLSNENAEVTLNLSMIFDELDKSPEDESPIFSRTLETQSRRISNSWKVDQNVQVLTSKVRSLEEQIEELTILNTKLSDLKLSTCTQCSHLKELNENKRALKLEIKCLNNKLEELQTKFQEKCASTEALRLKASEEVNTSNVTLNGSACEGMNITLMEENIRLLSNEKETLKEEYEKLAILYHDKCTDLEALQETQAQNLSNSSSPAFSSRSERIAKIESSVKCLGEDLQQHKGKLMALSTELQKYKELQDKLKSAQENYATAEEKTKLLEGEIKTLYETIEELNEKDKTLQGEKLNLEVELQILQGENFNAKKQVEELQKVADALNGEKNSLALQLEVVREEKEQIVTRQKYEESNREMMESTLATTGAIMNAALEESNKKLEESEGKIQELSVSLNKAQKENQDLTNEITRLQMAVQESIEIKLQEQKEKLVKAEIKMNEEIKKNEESIRQEKLRREEETKRYEEIQKKEEDIRREEIRINEEIKRLEEMKIAEMTAREELESARKLIIKETISLTSKVQDSESKGVADLFQVFMKTLMSKEHEIVKALKDGFDQEKLKLVEAKQQSEDSEKRANSWAKSLENDIEKMQSDLTHLEEKNTNLRKQIDRLEQGLEDTEFENKNLREKLEALKTDYNNLQIELERNLRNTNKEEDLNVIQERERMQASIKSKEMELQFKMKQEKEEYNKKLGELTSVLKNLETQNLDLKNNVDGLEANEKQLKSIIDIKSKELGKKSQLLKELQTEMEKLLEANNALSEEGIEKSRRIEDITSLLKNKCDLLSEYKTKMETFMPEYDLLRIQLEERKESVQKCKEEIEILKAEATREMNLLRDKLEEEQIKVAGSNKQLEELNNKNGVVLLELESMKRKCLEMEATNEKLMRKVRNSTSKVRAEKEMEDVVDKNRSLEKSLEGASNRISELLEAKTKAMTELFDLKGQVEMVKRENEELKTTMDSFKSRHNHLIELRAKYEELLQEKNKIRLELEEKKLTLAQKDKKMEEILHELNDLHEKNAELDKEAEDLAQVIKENEKDIARLEDENYDLKEQVAREIEELKFNLKSSLQTNTDLRAQIEILKRTEIAIVHKENEELKGKVLDMESKFELKSLASSRSSSPMIGFEKRKKRRSDLFNLKRHLDEVSDSGVSSNASDCQCSELRKSIAELGKEVAMKNGIIATLNVQIQSENFPYEKKCKDLQDELMLSKNKSRQLQQEIYNLKKTIMDTNSLECELCKNWRLNQRHQEVQCKIEDKIYLSGMSSGIVSEFKQIEKLEKEKALMRQLCRSRLAQIKQLESKLEQLTGQPQRTS